MSGSSVLKLGAPELYEKSQKVTLEQKSDIQKIIQSMQSTLDQAKGIALAAPQIGLRQRVVIYSVPKPPAPHPRYALTPEHDPEGIPLTALINPTISPLGDEMTTDWETCLSLPGLIGKVPRYKSIRFHWYDIEGKEHSREAHGFHARVVQHECDHLDGVLLPMRLQDAKSLYYQEAVFQ